MSRNWLGRLILIDSSAPTWTYNSGPDQADRAGQWRAGGAGRPELELTRRRYRLVNEGNSAACFLQLTLPAPTSWLDSQQFISKRSSAPDCGENHWLLDVSLTEAWWRLRPKRQVVEFFFTAVLGTKSIFLSCQCVLKPSGRNLTDWREVGGQSPAGAPQGHTGH